MKLDLIKTSENRYKLITNSTNKNHPALKHLAELLGQENKYSTVKIGIYSLFPNRFSPFQSVFSWISGRVEKMNRQKFQRFMKGSAQMAPQKRWDSVWKPEKINDEKPLEIEDIEVF